MPLACPSLVGCPSVPFPQQQEDSLEKVIKDTESLFKTREKEYQETIDQIEVRVSAWAHEPRCRCGAGQDQGCHLLTGGETSSLVVAVADP